MPRGNKTSPRYIQMVEEERRALELRKAGFTYEKIAQQMGLKSPILARNRVMKALDKTLQEPSEEVRKMELERLDSILLGLWPRILKGEPRAAEVGLSVMERRSRMLGLDAPVRKIVEVITEDAVDRAIRELEEQISKIENG